MDKTTWAGISAAIVSALTVLAALPYSLGDLATIIPPEIKPYVVGSGIVAAVILRSIQAIATKDK